jgi:hypothetical protein
MSPLAKKDDMVEALGLETNDVTFDEENEYGVKVPKTVRFVKTEKLGVLPRILQYLLSQRAATASVSRLVPTLSNGIWMVCN